MYMIYDMIYDTMR